MASSGTFNYCTHEGTGGFTDITGTLNHCYVNRTKAALEVLVQDDSGIVALTVCNDNVITYYAPTAP